MATLTADQSATLSTEPSAVPTPSETLPANQEADPQAISEAGLVAASLLMEAVQVIPHASNLLSVLSISNSISSYQVAQILPEQAIHQSADPRAETAPLANLSIEVKNVLFT